MTSIGIRLFLIAFVGLGIAACAGPGPTIPLSNTSANPIYIQSVTLRGGTQHFAESMQYKLRELESEDQPFGRPVDLEISVNQLSQTNAAASFLIGTNNSVESVVRLRDPQTGQFVFEQEQSSSTGGGGILGAIVQLASDEESVLAGRIVTFVDDELISNGVGFARSAPERFAASGLVLENGTTGSIGAAPQQNSGVAALPQTAAVASSQSGVPPTTSAAPSTQAASTNVAPSFAPTAPTVAAQPTVFVAFTSAWDETGARSHWSNLARSYPGQLGAYSPAIRPFSDGSGNTYYSVMIDRPVSLSEAENICYAVRQLDPGCLPIAQ